MNWGFDEDLIEIFTYIQSKDLKKYSYSTKAVVINHVKSKTIIIAFRGTELFDITQWLTDISTNFIHIDNVFNKNNNDPIRVHAGFYSALGLNAFNPSQPIDFSQVNPESPMFIQLLYAIQKIFENNKQYKISITGHSLGGALASLFSFILSCYGYESSIVGVYTYVQPLVGNYRYAKILNDELGNRFHRWVNHSDIVTRVPFIELPSIAGYFERIAYSNALKAATNDNPSETPYSDALEAAANNNPAESNIFRIRYYHSGLRFKINREGYLEREELIDQGPIHANEDKYGLLHFNYSFEKFFHALLNITPCRSCLWVILPAIINDHIPGDYARRIKKIVCHEQSNNLQ